MREAQLLHICLSAVWHRGVDKVQDNPRGVSADALGLLGEVR